MDEMNGILNSGAVCSMKSRSNDILQSGGAAVQAIIDKTKQCEDAMADTKKQLAACQARVLAEEENITSEKYVIVHVLECISL